MKTFLQLFLVASLVSACGGPGADDSVQKAQKLNQNAAIDEDISVFLTEAADARMMDLSQGKLASQKATSAELKEYGEWMVEDQSKMLQELKLLASSKNIQLPAKLSNEKAEALEDLNEKSGAEFDETFIRMITKDHKRDIDDFEDATDFKDTDVRQYAQTYLPVIESHLAKINVINENRKAAKN